MANYSVETSPVRVQKKQKMVEELDSEDDDDSEGSLVDFIVKDDDDENFESLNEDDKSVSMDASMDIDLHPKNEIEDLFDGLKSMKCDLNILKKNTINEQGIRRSTRQKKIPLRFTEEFKEDIQKCLLDDIPPEELPAALGLVDSDDSFVGSFNEEDEDEDYENNTDESEISYEDDDEDDDADNYDGDDDEDDCDDDDDNDEDDAGDEELLLPNGERV